VEQIVNVLSVRIENAIRNVIKKERNTERKRDGTKTVLAENRPFYDG
jgi:hypothetical protein